MTPEPWARISVCRTRTGRPVLLKLDPTILLMAGISPTGFACVFVGRDGRSLMLSGALEQDYDAAPIKYTRGRYVRVHWVRSGILAGMFPSEMVSTTVPVIRASNGQVVLDVSEIVSKRRWERSLTQRVPPSTKTALGEE
jgi:hypothetical protein